MDDNNILKEIVSAGIIGSDTYVIFKSRGTAPNRIWISIKYPGVVSMHNALLTPEAGDIMLENFTNGNPFYGHLTRGHFEQQQGGRKRKTRRHRKLRKTRRHRKHRKHN